MQKPDFENISRQLWPKLKEHRRNAMRVPVTKWRMFVNKYETDFSFQIRVDLVMVISIGAALGVAVVSAALWLVSFIEWIKN